MTFYCCSSAELYVVISIDALVSARNIVELPTVCVLALVLEYVVITVEIFAGFWPVLDVASSTDA